MTSHISSLSFSYDILKIYEPYLRWNMLRFNCKINNAMELRNIRSGIKREREREKKYTKSHRGDSRLKIFLIPA